MRSATGPVCAFAGTMLLLVGAAPQINGQTNTAPPNTPPPQSWSIVMVSQIKPEARQEWDAYQKEISAAYKKAGVPSRAVLETVFGDLNEFISVTPLAKFSDMDGEGPLVRALGADGAAKLRRRGAALVTSQRRFASLASQDLSIQTKTSEPEPYAMVTTLTLAPGKVQEFNAYMRDDYIPMLKKAQVANFWVNQTVFGGQSERVTVRLMKKLGDIDGGPLARRALGAEGAQKLAAKATGLTTSSRTSIVRYRADLSYEPAAAKPAEVSTR